MAVPVHCMIVRCSEKINIAPNNVQIGPVARIGDTMVNGRCLTAKNVKIHELVTITDLMKKNPCSLSGAGGINKMLLFNKPGKYVDKMTNGRKMVEEVRVEKKSTGSTALLFSESFLKTS